VAEKKEEKCQHELVMGINEAYVFCAKCGMRWFAEKLQPRVSYRVTDRVPDDNDTTWVLFNNRWYKAVRLQ